MEGRRNGLYPAANIRNMYTRSTRLFLFFCVRWKLPCCVSGVALRAVVVFFFCLVCCICCCCSYDTTILLLKIKSTGSSGSIVVGNGMKWVLNLYMECLVSHGATPQKELPSDASRAPQHGDEGGKSHSTRR